MTALMTDRAKSPGRADSESPDIEVHLLACGHGDTILICLPGDRWVLVDCHLPESDGTWNRFLEFVQARKIKRLEFIFQTHPDTDHFHGMTEVLDYFTSGGRSVGYWCDGGINTRSVRSLVWPNISSRVCYSRLQRKLDKLFDAGLLSYCQLNDHTYPLFPEGFEGRIEIVPVGPKAVAARRHFRKDMAKAARNHDGNAEANDLSVLLVLTVRLSGRHFNVLLAADAGPDQLDVALGQWKTYARNANRRQRFDVVKVPHHGSARSHLAPLCKQRRRSDPVIAAISAGRRDALPSPQVIDEYQSQGWVVLSTTTRHRKRLGDRPVNLINQQPPDVVFRSHNISATWSKTKGLNWAPREAVVKNTDTTAYAR